MADSTTRHELKRNELSEALEAGLEFAEAHLRWLLWGAGGLLFLALTSWGGWHWWSKRKAQASELLAQAIRIAEAPIVQEGARPGDSRTPSFSSLEERDRRAKETLEELVRRFSATPAGKLARFQLGVFAFREGRFPEAREAFEQYLRWDRRSALAVAAQEGLHEIERLEGRGEALAERLRQQVEKPDLVLPPDFLLIELGRTLERIGKPEEARMIYRRLLQEFSSSPYSQEAQQRLNSPELARSAA
jgi:tetratricopeptide (TPR) repeat protein